MSSEKADTHICKESQRYCAEMAALEMKRLELLMQHFGIDPASKTAWFDLAYHLALEYPGFRYKPANAGRKKQQDRFALVIQVEALDGEQGCGIANASRQLAKEGPFQGRHLSGPSIEKKYHQYKAELEADPTRRAMLTLVRKAPHGRQSEFATWFDALE